MKNPKRLGAVSYWVVALVLTAANAWAAHTGLSGWVRWPLFLLALAGLIGMTVAEFTDGIRVGRELSKRGTR